MLNREAMPRIVAAYGPMWSGKSSKLKTAYEMSGGIHVKLFRPVGDNRPPRAHEIGFKDRFKQVADLEALVQVVNEDRSTASERHLILIDEAHLFGDSGWTDLFSKLDNHRLFIAGLERGLDNKQFSWLSHVRRLRKEHLKNKRDDAALVRFWAECDDCEGGRACRSVRTDYKTVEEIAKTGDWVGGKERYKSTCLPCFAVYKLEFNRRNDQSSSLADPRRGFQMGGNIGNLVIFFVVLKIVGYFLLQGWRW
jgi:thymidine kinase